MTAAELLARALNDPDALPCPIHESADVPTERVVFSPDVRAACERNLCGRYGTCWVCPPGVGALEELRERYRRYAHAFVYTTKHQLEDSFDLEGMGEGKRRHEALDRFLFRELTGAGADFRLAGTGGCSLCPSCTYPDAPCRHPDLALPMPSLEALGVDVVALSRACGIRYNNGPDTVTYFSAVFS